MKVARLTTFLDFGGVEKRFENLSLSKHAHINNTFLAIGHGGRTELRMRERGVPIKCFNLPHKIPAFGTIFKLARYFRNEGFDVVHTSGAEANFHGILAARLAGIQVIVAEEIGFPKHGKAARSIFKWIYKSAQAVLVNARGVEDFLVKLGEIERSKSRIVANPCLIPDQHKTYPSKAQDVTQIITVSRLTAIKNLPLLLHVLKRLNKDQDQRYELKLVGEGEEREKLEQMVNELELKDYVDFTGFDRPLPHLLKADVYILPSFTEGFPNALVEAMAAGMNCIATQVGGPSDIIEPGVNGWLVDPNSPQDIYDKLILVTSQSQEKKAIVGANARETIMSRYSLESHMNQLYSIYTEHG